MNFNNQKINLINLVPREWNVENLDNDFIRIFYKTIGRGNDPKPFILSKNIIIDKELIEGISMYLGDGKLSKDLHHLEFDCKDKDMVKFMHTFFVNKFDIKNMYYRLTYKNLSNNSIQNWADYLNISKNLINTRKSERHKEECFGFQIGGKIFRILFEKITNKTMELDLLNNIELRRAFLKGLFAAEGNIAINRKENYIVCIQYCLHINEDKIANFVNKILDLENISCVIKKTEKDNSMLIRTTNWKNYWKMYKIGIFDLNERKKEMFLDKVKKTKFYFKITDNLKNKFLKKN